VNTIKRMFILSFLFSAAAVYAQVAPSVTGHETELWAGGEYSRYIPDYGATAIQGLGAMFDINLRHNFGVIGEARWLRWSSGDFGETQSDYLAGAKYRLLRYKRFDVNAKILLGGVWIRFPGDIGTGSYFAYAPGGMLDYHLSKRFLIRGDYEYQFLPSAPNIPGQPNEGLTPHGWSIGAEYSIFHTR
jgi:hypothetical protein